MFFKPEYDRASIVSIRTAVALPHQFISRDLYSHLVNKYPALSTRRDYRAFAFHALLQARRDRFDSTRFLMDRHSLAHALHQDKELGWRKFDGIGFLKQFQREVVDPTNQNSPLLMEISSHGPKRARNVTVDHSPPLPHLLETEPLRLIADPNPVCAYTGGSLSKATRTRLLAAERKLLRAEAQKHPSSHGAQWLKYLNAQRGNVLSSLVKKNFLVASQALPSLSRAEQKTLALELASIRQFPVPLLHCSPTSHRIFPNHPSLGTIDSTFRQVLMHGCFECDIKSANYRILARIWRLSLAEQFLRGGGDLWEEIGSTISLKPGSTKFQDFKDKFKATFNSIVYLADEPSIRTHTAKLLRSLGSVHAPDEILAHPLIKELFVAREHAGKQALLTGRVQACGGKRLQLKDHKKGVGSLLSSQVSSYELALLTPALLAVQGSERASIVLYQYDGFTLHVRDQSRAAAWKRKLTKAMEVGARNLGIELALTWKDL